MRTAALTFLITVFVLDVSLRAAERAAFIVGNDSYPDNPLTNAVRDARAVKSMLAGSLRFPEEGIVHVENADRLEMFEKFESFKKVASDAEIVVIYYAGHGMESIDGKENFLLPVDVPVKEAIRSEAILRASGVNLMTLCSELAGCSSGAKVVLMDCCRERPAGRGLNRAGGGLVTYADADIPADTLMILAAAPNRVASDGADHGPFTEAVLNVLPSTGGNLMDAFFAVSDRVRETTRETQIPWLKFDGSGQIFREQSFLANGEGNAGPVTSPGSEEMRILRERLARIEKEREAERKAAMTPPPAAPPREPTPESTVMDYYAAINSRSIEDAYALRSRSLNQSYTLQKFRSTFSGTRKTDLSRVKELSNDGSIASVQISVEVLDDGGTWSTWSGNIALEKENGIWKISSMKGLREAR